MLCLVSLTRETEEVSAPQLSRSCTEVGTIDSTADKFESAYHNGNPLPCLTDISANEG